MQECGPREHRNGIACHPSHCPPTCHSPIKYIVDATLGYPDDYVAGVDQIIGGEMPRPDQPYSVSVHYRVFPICDVPLNDESQLRDWMYNRWVEKDKLLDDFYRTGVFPQPRGKVDWDMRRTILAEAFWAVAWYLHWRLWLKTLLSHVASVLF